MLLTTRICGTSTDQVLQTWHCLQDVLKYYKASLYGSGPPALGCRSPRESYDPHAEDFMRERGSYQDPMEHP